MKVPFQLRRSPERFPATGLLLPSFSVANLLELCARLRQDFPEAEEQLPAIFRTADGFLVRMPRPTSTVHGGVLHLRSLAGNLLLPCDAVLTPGLLEEEAVSMVRLRGLVFLPGGRVLAFDPQQPLQASDLLTAPRRSRQPWQALPPRPALAERLREIRLELPEPPVEDVLAPGGAGIGEAEPRPSKAGLAGSLAGEGLVQAGKGMAWLASLLHWKGLAEWGARLARAGLERAPRLMESVLGRQEAALRELLRKFREGNLEEALRHALPLGPDTDRGGTTARDAQLPTHRVRYDLGDLLRSGQGRARWWQYNAAVHAELSREYRKAAQTAVERGDYRRAAFIYGRLLHDFRQAAAVLARGGLHHDAALLYLHKVGDRRAAAREYEAAGDLARAVELYRQMGQHVEAGDLLQRAGEDEAALQEYLLAVERLIPSDFAGAGDLLLEHAHRRDLALDYYRRGWAARPQANAFPCLMRLLSWHTEAAESGPLLELLGQAEAVFAQPGNDTAAATFYNQLALDAHRKELASLRDELRDRALCGLAGKLRERSAGSARDNAVSLLLGRSTAWQAAVVHDAEVAFKRASEERPLVPSPQADELRMGEGPVTALCSAWLMGGVFFGFASGEVCYFHPRSDRRIPVPPVWGAGHRISGLSCNGVGTTLVVLLNSGAVSRLVSYRWEQGGYRVQKEQLSSLSGPGQWLTACTIGPREVVGFWDGAELHVLETADLVALSQLALPFPETTGSSAILAAALLSLGPSGGVSMAIACTEEQLWWFAVSPPARWRFLPLGGVSRWRTEIAPMVSYRVRGREHVVRLDQAGCIHELQVGDQGWLGPEHRTAAGGYLAAAWLAPGEVVGVRSDGVDWLRKSGGLLLPWASQRRSLTDAIGCFSPPGSSEVLVVLRSGMVVRLRRPR